MTETLGRDAIVTALKAALEPLPFVAALVEGGAAAWGRLDAWSDIDLNVFADTAKVDVVFLVVEGALRDLSPIEHTFVAHGPSEGEMQQKFYRLERTSPFLLVDLAVLTTAAREKFLEAEIHGDNIVYFDRTGITIVPPLDRMAFDEKVRARFARLRDETEMFHRFVEKEANRGNWIEAVDNYRVYVLAPLLEVLRMKHGPLHHRFRSRYVHYELPREVVVRLQGLFFVSGPDDLQVKYPEALRWFREIAADLRQSSAASSVEENG